MSAKIQVASVRPANQPGRQVVWQEIEIDFMALAEVMLGREPALRRFAGQGFGPTRKPKPFVPHN